VRVSAAGAWRWRRPPHGRRRATPTPTATPTAAAAAEARGASEAGGARSSARTGDRPESGGSQSVTKAVVQFAVTGMAAVALLGFVAVQILQHTGETEAIRDAQHETSLAGVGIVAPGLEPGMASGRPGALAALDRLVHRYVLRYPVARVKIWNASGRVLYSDEHRLIGATYVLGADELAALRTGGVAAEVSDLSKPENRFERPLKKLLEVYVGIRGPGGQPLLYEEYLKYSSVAASGNRLWSSFGPALVLTLVLLELAQIPLAWSLARRLRRRQDEREMLLRRAIEASDVERRRIAGELHDGVVQNLAGVSYTLSAASAGIRSGAGSDAGEIVDRAAAETRASIRQLRTLLVDIYPPALERSGLVSALADLIAMLEARDITTEIDLDADFELPPEREPILYRVAQEALRNVARHSHATHVRIHAGRENGSVVLSVEDDGRGFVPGQRRRAEDKEHFGLRILDDLARDAGGRLTVASSPGGGTRVEIEVPV
jgi:two-component system NarL family sensor kinase